MNLLELESILQKMPELKIAIVGDFCLDVYWQLNIKLNEISVETLKPIQKVSSQRSSLGGAGNLANNIRALGVKNISVFGLVGNDFYGYELKRLLTNLQIESTGLLIQNHEYLTNVYLKPMDQKTELNRYDLGCDNLPDKTKLDELLSLLNKNINNYDAILINQQITNGIHTEYFRQKLTAILQKYKGHVFLDSRHYPLEFGNVIRKLNDYELCSLVEKDLAPKSEITLNQIEKCANLKLKNLPNPTVITRGAESTIIYHQGKISQMPSAKVLGPIDSVGAGDSFLSGLATGFLLTNKLSSAVTLGQKVAAITIKKIGETGVATPIELIKNHQD